MTYTTYLIHLVMLIINWLIIDQTQWLSVYGISGVYGVVWNWWGARKAELPMGSRDRLRNFDLCFGSRAESSPVKIIVLSTNGENYLSLKYLLSPQSHQPISIATPISPDTRVPPSRKQFCKLALDIHFNLLSHIFLPGFGEEETERSFCSFWYKQSDSQH